MSTKASLIYGAWISLIESTLPTYARITNGLAIEDAPSIVLRKGYAMIPTGGENTERQICGKRSYKRGFDIILINQILATENNTTTWDTIIKSLHEDVSSLFHEVEKSSTLNDMTNGLGTSKITGDSGINFVSTDDLSKYFQIFISAETEYFENL